MHFIKVYYMHEILSLIFNKNVSQFSGPKKQQHKTIHVFVKLLYQMMFVVLCMLNKP